jgi:putative inorganic carbon (hco3(-)) transporter
MIKSRSLSFYGVLFLLIAGALNFRLRLATSDVHIGGAEFALAPYDFVIFVFVPYLIGKYWSGKIYSGFDAINTAAFIFISLSFASIFNSVDPQFTIYEWLRHLKVFVLFLLLRRLFAKTNAPTALIYASLIIIFFEFFVSLSQLGAGEAEVTEDAAEVKEVFVEGGLVRVSGTLRHPNLLGLFINMLIPFSIVGVLHYKSKFQYLLALIVAFIILLLTYSRTQIALYGFILFWAFFTFDSSKGKKLYHNKASWYVVVPLLLILLGVVVANFDTLYERFFNAPESNTATRFVLAAIAVEMISEHPIVGVGWNTFVYAMSQYDFYKAAAAFQYPVHNMYLLIASETGLLGLASYLALLAAVFRAYRYCRKRLTDPFERNLLQAAFVVSVLVLITGLQGWSFRADSIQLIVWICYALIAAMFDRVRFKGR